jgi:hypothetical protein
MIRINRRHRRVIVGRRRITAQHLVIRRFESGDSRKGLRIIETTIPVIAPVIPIIPPMRRIIFSAHLGSPTADRDHPHGDTDHCVDETGHLLSIG